MRFVSWDEGEGYDGEEELSCHTPGYEALITIIPITRPSGRKDNEISVSVSRYWEPYLSRSTMKKIDCAANITEAKALVEKMADQLEKLI